MHDYNCPVCDTDRGSIIENAAEDAEFSIDTAWDHINDISGDLGDDYVDAITKFNASVVSAHEALHCIILLSREGK